MQTIDDIVGDLISGMSKGDVTSFLEVPRHDLHVFHHSLGRYIRNRYSLWGDSPLTKSWRDNPNDRDMKDGIDYSDDHPDAISMAIIFRLHDTLNANI